MYNVHDTNDKVKLFISFEIKRIHVINVFNSPKTSKTVQT